MKKFGFGKKTEGDDNDRSRSVFGRKKPSAQEDNPYAQQPVEDPYARMTPYQQARANLAAGPQAPRQGAVGLPGGPRPGGGGLPGSPDPAARSGYGTPPPYQAGPHAAGGYASDRFGAAGGYGSNRYDSGASAYRSAGSTSSLPSQRGPGGYGGLGSDYERKRDELLGGEAQKKHAVLPSYGATDYNTADTSGAANGSYSVGGYGAPRELTAEEEEEEEYQRLRNEGKQIKRDDLASLERSTQIGLDAIAVSRGTLARLGEQEERLRNVEKNLDIGTVHQKVAAEKTGELQTLNRSMFAIHVSNPFTKAKREAQREQQVLDRHRQERGEAEATRSSAYRAQQEFERDFKEAEALGLKRAPAPTSEEANARRKELMFDEGDEEEVGLEDGMVVVGGELSKVVGTLHQHALAMNKTLDRQNGLIDNLADKVSRVCSKSLRIKTVANFKTEQRSRRRSGSDQGQTGEHSLMFRDSLFCSGFTALCGLSFALPVSNSFWDGRRVLLPAFGIRQSLLRCKLWTCVE